MLAPPGVYPEVLKGWEKVMDAEELVLYANPAFKSIFVVELDTGESVSLFAENAMFNTRKLRLPQGSVVLRIAETYHRNWRYSLDGKTWGNTVLSGDGYYGMEINVIRPLPRETEVVMQVCP